MKSLILSQSQSCPERWAQLVLWLGTVEHQWVASKGEFSVTSPLRVKAAPRSSLRPQCLCKYWGLEVGGWSGK
jgi:hypothetical protein